MKPDIDRDKGNKRVFYNLMERVGNRGTYTSNVFKIFLILDLIGSSTFFINPFLFYQDPYTCQGVSSASCNQMVCSLPSQQRKAFLPPPTMINLGNFNGDHHCQNNGAVILMQYSMFFGAMLGLLVGIFITDIAGRRKTGISAISISITGILTLLLFQSIYIKCFALIIWCTGTQLSFTMLNPFLLELVAQEDRSKYYVYFRAIVSIGATVNAGIFYLLKNWKLVLSLFYGLLQIIALILFVSYVESPPIEIISKSKNPQEAFEAFMRIAKINNNQHHGITLHQITAIYQRYHLTLRQVNHTQNFTILDVFRFPSLRSDFLKLGVFMFVMLLDVYGPSLLFGKIFSNVFLNGALIGLTKLSSVPLLLFINGILERQKGLMLMLGLSFLFNIFQYIMNPIGCIKSIVGTSQILIMICFFLQRFFANLASNFFGNCLNQTFPAQIRSICIFGVIGIAKLSNLLIPVIASISSHLKIACSFIFAIVCLIGVFSAYFIRQTLNIPLPQIIQELKETKKQITLIQAE